MSAPKAPKIPKPEPIPEPLTVDQTNLIAQEEAAAKRKRRKGFKSTILTGQSDGATSLLGG